MKSFIGVLLAAMRAFFSLSFPVEYSPSGPSVIFTLNFANTRSMGHIIILAKTRRMLK